MSEMVVGVCFKTPLPIVMLMATLQWFRHQEAHCSRCKNESCPGMGACRPNVSILNELTKPNRINSSAVCLYISLCPSAETQSIADIRIVSNLSACQH